MSKSIVDLWSFGNPCGGIDVQPVGLGKDAPIAGAVVIHLDYEHWISLTSESAKALAEELLHVAAFVERMEKGDLPGNAVEDYRRKKDRS